MPLEIPSETTEPMVESIEQVDHVIAEADPQVSKQLHNLAKLDSAEAKEIEQAIEE